MPLAQPWDATHVRISHQTLAQPPRWLNVRLSDGQITEVEGKKATEAIGRLNTAQSDKAFKQALGDLRDVVEGSMKRTSGEGGASGGWGEKPIPPAAVNDLKMRGPKAHAQFDAIFGQGAAARALGGN